MHRFFLAFAAVLLLQNVHGDERHLVYTQPEVPSQEALDRLNLKMLWRAFAPMDGRRDGFHEIQVLDNQVLVRTRSGMVIMFNGETGEILWKKLFGRPYQVAHNLAFNQKFVFAINENDLYVLNRHNGDLVFQTSMGIGLTAAPTADQTHVYLCGFNRRIYCFALPLFKETGEFIGYEKPEFNVPEGKTKREIKVETLEEIQKKNSFFGESTQSPFSGKGIRSQGRQPLFLWEYQTRLALNYPLLITPEIVGAVGQQGDLISLSKYSELRGTTTPFTTGYEVGQGLIAAPTVQDSTAYIGSLDSTLHAFDMKTGKLDWRFTVGSPIHQKPFVTDNEVFVVGEKNGLARVSRSEGQSLWSIPSGNRFSNTQEKSDRMLAANPKFLYTLDKSGRMVILDRGLGLAFSTWDIHDFAFPVPNRVNDRVFLAANNGLLVCMRDRDYPHPVPLVKQPETVVADAVPKGEPAEKLLTLLVTKVSEMALDEKPLGEILDYLARKYSLKFHLNPKAFMEAKIENPEKKPGKIPDTKDQTLGELLNSILDPLEMAFQPVLDTVLIAPKAKNN